MPRQSKLDWPRLPAFAEWQGSFTTLHMWVQVVGKIRLKLSPWVNHSWGSTLYVTSSGFTTSLMSHAAGSFCIDFDFINHMLRIATSDGETRAFALEPMTVAAFYRKTMQALSELGIHVRIFTQPVEVMEAARFEDDVQHASYDPETVQRLWHAFVLVDGVFKIYRAGFIGKASPVHFFWGAFDLAVSRYSGRPAPRHPGGVPNCADWVMQEAYSHEVASAGFWPGAGLGEAAFYAYAYPEPAGYSARTLQPAAAYYSDTLKEFILPYEAVRNAASPEQMLLEFLKTSYEGAADLGGWDRAKLECDLPGRK